MSPYLYCFSMLLMTCCWAFVGRLLSLRMMVLQQQINHKNKEILALQSKIDCMRLTAIKTAAVGVRSVWTGEGQEIDASPVRHEHPVSGAVQ